MELVDQIATGQEDVMNADRVNRRCRECRKFKWLSDFRDTVKDGTVCRSCLPEEHAIEFERELAAGR